MDVDAYSKRAAEVEAERNALLKFKEYVHARLDEAGIPTHPEGPHSAEGCRVGDRLDIALAFIPAARVAHEAIELELSATAELCWEGSLRSAALELSGALAKLPATPPSDGVS